ncbi:MAG: hypothetical protein WA160_13535 [Pseudobdellovibrio sp.]
MEILKNGVFVSCEPTDRVEQIAPGLIEERIAEVGQTYLICDMKKEEVGKAKLAEAFTTTFGNPDPRLLELLGFAGQPDKFHSQYAGFYQQQFPGEVLIEDTELFVTVYEPVRDS